LEKICHIESCGHFEFLRKCFFFKKTDNKPNLINLKENLKKNKFPSFNNEKRFDIHLKFGRHFQFSCLKILILIFCNLKSIRIKKKLDIHDLQTKLWHLKKLVKKNRHFDLFASEFLEKKIVPQKTYF
jgi:hypothetical protein